MGDAMRKRISIIGFTMVIVLTVIIILVIGGINVVNANKINDSIELGIKYLTEEEYNKALQQKRAEEQEARCKEQEERRKQTMAPDPLADTDKTIYNFCSVVFQSTRQPYAYLTGSLDIKIGDKVVVPVGSDGKEVVATVVSTSQHMRLTAPYPVDRARTVIKKIED